MPFKDVQEVEMRLTGNDTPLSSIEIRELYPWMQELSTGAARRLSAELSLQNLDAIRRFDKNSSKVAVWGPLLNIALFVLTVVAVCIALVTYWSAEESGRKQLEALKTARSALETVVGTAIKQQGVLEQNLVTSKAQLDILQRQWAAELDRSRRKPAVSVSLGNINLSKAKSPPVYSLPLDSANEGKLVFLVRNAGTAPVNSPTIIMLATPNTVRLDPPRVRGIPRDDPNVYQISGQNILDIQPMSLMKMPSSYSVDVEVPKGLMEFNIRFTIFAANLPKHSVEARFIAVR